jgi:hypothetical protein
MICLFSLSHTSFRGWGMTPCYFPRLKDSLVLVIDIVYTAVIVKGLWIMQCAINRSSHGLFHTCLFPSSTEINWGKARKTSATAACDLMIVESSAYSGFRSRSLRLYFRFVSVWKPDDDYNMQRFWVPLYSVLETAFIIPFISHLMTRNSSYSILVYYKSPIKLLFFRNSTAEYCNEMAERNKERTRKE